MKKSDRLKPKKKRLYRIDHWEALRRWEASYNKPLEESFARFRKLLEIHRDDKHVRS